MLELYDRVVNRDLLIRRVSIAACNLIPEDGAPREGAEQLDFFTDYDAVEQGRKAEETERRLQQVTLEIHDRFGKNALLKGMNLLEGGTTIERNGQIGGHRAGEDDG